uniref:Uncharacterized protein n=1 Tax=Timema douglasi TaxID=61478 RepID=A0A7R8VDM4_TIMDO|nr:unnamed protein product [Timema douglasi]
MSGTTTNRDCPLCKSQGKQAKLRLFQATSEEAMLFCEDDECPYPFDEEDHEFCMKRDWSEAVENWNILRKAEDLEFQKHFGHIEINKSSQQMCLYKDIPLGEMANDSEKLLNLVNNLKQLQEADASLLAVEYKDKNETLTMESSDKDDDEDDNEKQNSVTLFKPLRDNKRLEMLMANVPSEETFLKELENFEEILEDTYGKKINKIDSECNKQSVEHIFDNQKPMTVQIRETNLNSKIISVSDNEPGESGLVGMNCSENSSTVELPSINTGNANCEEPARTGMSQEIIQPSVPINKLDQRFEEMQTHCIDQNITSSNQDTDQLNNQDLSKIGVLNIPIVQDKEIDQHEDGIAQTDKAPIHTRKRKVLPPDVQDHVRRECPGPHPCMYLQGSQVHRSNTPCASDSNSQPNSLVDSGRIKEVGPDRACAEWLMKNGAFVKWENESDFLKNYDCLPPEDDRRHIVEVDATEASITYLEINFTFLVFDELREPLILRQPSFMEQKVILDYENSRVL